MPIKSNRKAYRGNFYHIEWVGPPSVPIPADNVLRSLNGFDIDSVFLGEGSADWKDRIRRGVSATTDLDGIRYKTNVREDGYAIVRNYWEFLDIHRNAQLRGAMVDLDQMSLEDPSGIFMVSVKNKVIQRFNDEIRSAQKSLQGLVSLGELGETARMMNSWGRSLFGKTRDYLFDLEKIGRRLTPQNILRTVSEKWLEYRFGIRPLVDDIQGFSDALYSARYGRPPQLRIKAAAESIEKNLSTVTGLNVPYWSILTLREQERSYGFKLYGVVGLTDNNVPTFSQEFGVTLDEFVPTLWELIPYSFLVDYISNVGAVIDGYSLNKSGLLWVNYGDLRQATCTLTGTVTPNPPSGYVVQHVVIHPSTPVTRSKRLVRRGSYIWPLVPSLEFRIPGTSTQWLNIGALAAQHARTSKLLRGRS